MQQTESPGKNKLAGRGFPPDRCLDVLGVSLAHLANANKFGHIRRINTLLGLYVPLLVTPLELLGEV